MDPLKYLKLFQKKEYILIKYPYLIKKKIDDLDLLISNKSFYKFKSILKKQGFKEVLTEFNEKYKIMMKKWDGKKFINIHLHKEIAWNGIIALKKNLIFKRKKEYKEFYIPSLEDTFMINVAHVLLELKFLRDYERKLFNIIKTKPLDLDYIKYHLNLVGWKKSFFNLINLGKINRMSSIFSILIKKPLLIYNFINHYIKWLLSNFLIKKVILIAIIGPDGSGKSTTACNLIRWGFKRVYGGWKNHKLLTSKLLCFFGKTNTGRKLRKKFEEKREIKISFVQELIYINYVFEHFLRYSSIFFRRLKKNHVVFDRYFYDIFMQDKNAYKSRILSFFIKIFPKPDYIFYLHANPQTLIKRKKENLGLKNIRLQQKRVEKLKKNFKIITLDVDKLNKQQVLNEIITHIWGGL